METFRVRTGKREHTPPTSLAFHLFCPAARTLPPIEGGKRGNSARNLITVLPEAAFDEMSRFC